MIERTRLRTALRICVLAGALFGVQLAATAAPWGPFGSWATYGTRSTCLGDSAWYGFGGRHIKAELFVVHGTVSRPDGTVRRRYEAIYAINRNNAFYPFADVGVLNTNDTFAGAYIPFAYNEIFRVPRATSTSDNDRVVVEYDGVGINLGGTCRVKGSG